MRVLAVLIGLAAAFFGGTLAIFSRSFKKLLIGMLVQSIFLALALLMLGAGYFAVSSVVIFIAIDIAIYFFLKSVLLPMPASDADGKRVYFFRTIQVWFGAVLLSLGIALVGHYASELKLYLSDGSLGTGLEQAVWNNSAPVLAFTGMLLILSVAGGFLLVRKE